MKKMTKEEYGQLAREASPATKSWVTIPKAFLVGGLICMAGQGLLRLYQSLGVSEELAPAWVSVTLIFCSVLATGLNVYDKLAKHAGAGTLVPITGFANSVASPALEFKTEGYVYGMAAKMFNVAGPIIVFGVSGGAAVGLIYWLIAL